MAEGVMAEGVMEEGTAAEALVERGGKYLTFRLQHEEYGLEILKVREIMGLMNITSVPQMPRYVAGVINLRGKVIPVVDLRLKFGMPHEEFTDETCVIVVEVTTQDDEESLVGIIVDTVSEVLDIPGDQIEPAPEFGVRANTEFILGIGKVGDEVKILLNIDKVLSMQEISSSALAAATEQTAQTGTSEPVEEEEPEAQTQEQ